VSPGLQRLVRWRQELWIAHWIAEFEPVEHRRDEGRRCQPAKGWRASDQGRGAGPGLIAVSPRTPRLETLTVLARTARAEVVDVDARRVVLAVLVGMVLAASARAATWSSAGPAPAAITGFGFDPAAPSMLYAGTAGGAVFRSTDGGATWLRTGPTGDFPIRTIVVRGSVVFAVSDSGSNTGVGGVYRSLDAGGSWSFAGPAAGITNGSVRPLAVDPTSPSTLLVGTNGGLFRSVDGGSTWSPVAVPTGPQISDVLFDPANPGVAYVSTSNAGASRSTDHGAMFTAFNTGWASNLDGGLELDGTTLYGASFYGAVSTSTAAAAWADISSGLPSSTYVNDIVLVGGHLLASTSNGMYATPTSFISWNPTTPTPFAVYRLLVDPSGPARVYAFGNGLARSANAGLSWERLDAAIPGLGVSRVAATGPGSLLVGTNDRGMLRSDDLGATFAASSDGFTATSVDGLVVDPVDPANVLAASSPSIFGSTDGGHTWSPRSFGTSFYSGVLAIAPSDPRVVYGAAFSGAIGFARRSVNGGVTWNPIPTPTTFNFAYALAVDPTNADTAYLGADTVLYKTTAGGMPWTTAGGGLPASTLRDLAIDPTAPATVYAATGASVWRSADGATSFVPTGALPPGAFVNRLLVDPLRPQTLYAATQDGALRSADAGGSWQAFSDGLPNRFVHSLSLDRDHAALYAATDGGLAVSRFVAALHVTPTLTAAFVGPSGQTTLSALVANDGPDDATRLALSVGTTLDVAVASASIPGGTCTTSPAVVCQLGRLGAKQAVVATFDLQAATTTGAATLTLAATAAQDVGGAASGAIGLRVVDGPFVADEVIRVVKRKALVTVVCATTTKKACKGGLRLTPVASGAKPKVLGKAHFAIRRGRTATLKVRLKGVKLAAGDQLAADLTIRTAGASETSRVTLQGE
jgi:hypothetical protein